jgi:hypothetical protein
MAIRRASLVIVKKIMVKKVLVKKVLVKSPDCGT